MQFNLKGGYVMLSGIAGSDGTIRQTKSGKFVGRISLNINKYGEQAKWVHIDGWNEVAGVMKYVKKGDRVICIGTTFDSTYTNKAGEQVTEKMLNAEFCFDMGMYAYLCDLVLGGANANGEPAQTGQANVNAETGELEEDDGELPF